MSDIFHLQKIRQPMHMTLLDTSLVHITCVFLKSVTGKIYFCDYISNWCTV